MAIPFCIWLLLINKLSTRIQVNARNVYGFTAMDILVQSRRDVKDMDIAECLQGAGALRSKDIPMPMPMPAPDDHKFETSVKGSCRSSTTTTMSSISSYSNNRKRLLTASTIANSEESSWEYYFKLQDDWLDKQRDALMAVASLIATMAFGTGVNPPGGDWSDNFTVDSQGNPVSHPHMAGWSIYADQDPVAYLKFLIYNTTSFIASLSITLLLISGLPFKRRLFMWILMVIVWIAIGSVALNYMGSMPVLTPSNLNQVSYIMVVAILIWLCLMAILILVHSIRLLMNMTKKFKGFLRRGRRRAT